MLVNLNIPYSSKFSLPRNSDVVFFSKMNDNMLFEKGKDIEIYCVTDRKGITLDWFLSRNIVKRPFLVGKGEQTPAYIWKIVIPHNVLYCGFYDLRVGVNCGDGSNLNAICTFGYDAENMKTDFNRPDDFLSFWEESKKKLEDIKLEPQISHTQLFVGKQIDDYNMARAALPGDYDEGNHRINEVEACKVSFNSANEIRIHGWLAKPKVEGKLPAMIVFPGAGFSSRSIPLEHARHGYLALDIQVHGQDVDLDKYSPSEDFIKFNDINLPKEYYYNNIYLHTVQAINYICSRDDVDINKIVVVGGSQGGRLSIVAAALDKRVKAVVAGITHNANIPYIKWAEKLNDYSNSKDGMDVEVYKNEVLNGEAYYDVMNFAPDISCPVLMNCGLIDHISPPVGIFGIYNNLSLSEKKIVTLPSMAHDWSVGFDTMAWKWLELQFKGS